MPWEHRSEMASECGNFPPFPAASVPPAFLHPAFDAVHRCYRPAPLRRRRAAKFGGSGANFYSVRRVSWKLLGEGRWTGIQSRNRIQMPGGGQGFSDVRQSDQGAAANTGRFYKC